MIDAIARYYDESKNPDRAFFPGVPLRDLTATDWDALDKRMQESVDASAFYRKTKPRADAPAEKAASDDAPDAVAARRAIIFKE